MRCTQTRWSRRSLRRLLIPAECTQIVEAERFLEDKPKLKGKDLAKEVDKQDWDPSVKALTAFPSVLANLNKDLSWTSTLGDANINQPADVMDAVQFLRKKAEDAGNLKTTPQQTVANQNGAVVIQPADPQVVYVPEYDPTRWSMVTRSALWPGFYPWWGVLAGSIHRLRRGIWYRPILGIRLGLGRMGLRLVSQRIAVRWRSLCVPQPRVLRS